MTRKIFAYLKTKVFFNLLLDLLLKAEIQRIM